MLRSTNTDNKSVAKSFDALTRRRLLTVGVLLSLTLQGLLLPSHATDGMACVASQCGRELSTCLANPSCAQGLSCFITCSVGPSREGACQTRCMDLYQSPLLDAFTECSLTDHACYPPLVSDPRYPPLIVHADQLWQSNLSFEPKTLQNLFNGKWYLSAGLNPVFDTFDCQTHEFRKPNAPNVKKNGGVPIADATFSYRVQVNENKWFTRTGDKRLTFVNEDSTYIHDGKWRGFDQGLKWGMDFFLDENHDEDIHNHLPDIAANDNVNTKSPRLVLTLRPELMNYKDDWVVLQSSPEYIVLLYRGTNSAWEGYGGLNVYTRTRTISDTLKRDIERGLRKVNLSLRDLTIVDNSCPKE